MNGIIGDRIKQLRKGRGLTQKQFAMMLSDYLDKPVSISTVSGYETGYREPDAHTLWIIADLFKVSVDWVMGIKEVRHDDTMAKEIFDSIPNSKLMESVQIEKALDKIESETNKAFSDITSDTLSRYLWGRIKTLNHDGKISVLRYIEAISVNEDFLELNLMSIEDYKQE